MQHLRGGKTITSLEAINLYSATRLSAIIFCLRNKGHNIVTIPITILDKYGNNCHYAEYKLLDVELIEGDKPLSQQWDDNTHKFLVDARETANKNFSNLLQDELKETNDKNFFKRLWAKITK